MKENELLEIENKISHNAKDIKLILEKLENNSSKIQANSIALDILKDYKKERDRAFVVILILLVVVIMLVSIVIYHHWIV